MKISLTVLFPLLVFLFSLKKKKKRKKEEEEKESYHFPPS